MSSFVYVLAEGVHDVAFLGKLLTVGFDAKRIKTMEELDEARRDWMASFKWPLTRGGKIEIDRLAVPAPVFHRLPAGTLVALRNAQGLTNVHDMLERDLESFDRDDNRPDSIGVVLDSDEEPADARFRKLVAFLQEMQLTAPSGLGQVAPGAPRVGVFALPAPGVAGTLEDVLLQLGEAAFPELYAAARVYAEQGRSRADTETGRDWKEIKKPAGPKKATIGAMTAVLKPGKSMQTSLDDNGWVSESTRTLPCVQPCLSFLRDLLTVAPVATRSEP